MSGLADGHSDKRGDDADSQISGSEDKDSLGIGGADKGGGLHHVAKASQAISKSANKKSVSKKARR